MGSTMLKNVFVKGASKVLDNADMMEPTVSTMSSICAGVEVVTKVAVPFANFLPLIGEVAKLFNEIVDIYQKAEHNKRICGVMLDRVQVAETAVINLKNRREENENFFS